MKRQRRNSTDGSRRAGFTLIEMLVVMSIVLVLAGLVLPGINSMWAERRIAETQTLVQGMLQTARSRAMRAGGTESGLFFYLDDGAQRIVSIEKDRSHSGEVAWENVFVVTDERQYKLSRPMRVVPRYIVDPLTNADGSAVDPLLVFSDEEIVNDIFETLGANIDNGQRHRNYFAMVFSAEGQLVVRRDVLLQDLDADVAPSSQHGFGDITGLPVSPDNPPTLTQFFDQDGKVVTTKDDVELLGPAKLANMIFDSAAKAAINFPTVDGLLAYDDAAFRELDTAEAKRDYFLESAQPFYVNRYTGAVVRGPIGDN